MLTNIEVKNAKPKDKDYTLNGGEGLLLLVKTTGKKLWRFRYSFSGKRCLISLGKFSGISLKEARVKQREFLDMLARGINPAVYKQAQREKIASQKSFKEVALKWHAKHNPQGNQRHNKLILQRMEKYLFARIGKIPIEDIEAPVLFNLMEAIQDQGYIITAKRVNSYCSMVFRYGVAKGYCKRDITQDYRGMLKSVKSKHQPTITDPDGIGELLADMENYSGTSIVKTALMISAYVFVRPSELVNSKWKYIDFDTCHWLIPAKYMKMKSDHLIPFPLQVKKLLENLYTITGDGEYIFPSAWSQERCMSSETVNKTLRKIEDGKYKGKMVSHGFRGMASTILNENKFRYDVIERQLAHQERNKIRGAYNHAEYLPERVEMMQWYADYLDGLRSQSN